MNFKEIDINGVTYLPIEVPNGSTLHTIIISNDTESVQYKKSDKSIECISLPKYNNYKILGLIKNMTRGAEYNMKDYLAILQYVMTLGVTVMEDIPKMKENILMLKQIQL